VEGADTHAADGFTLPNCRPPEFGEGGSPSSVLIAREKEACPLVTRAVKDEPRERENGRIIDYAILVMWQRQLTRPEAAAARVRIWPIIWRHNCARQLFAKRSWARPRA
jgi:hypothetical protein